MTKSELYSEYGSYHKNHRNRVCHSIGIPLIVLGILGLASLVRIGPVDLAIPIALAVLLYFATISLRGALLSLIVFAVIYAIAIHLTWQINAAAFVLGWGFQLIGHRFEGNKPKFLENLTFLLIGPLYVFEELFDSIAHRRRLT